MSQAQGIVGEFLALKSESDADLLAMQVGDFYEFFGDDAHIVSRELDLNVSEKSTHGSSYAMAGVPVNDLGPYLNELVDRGYRVAVADQHETETGHSRSLTRLVTTGTLLETDTADARHLGAIVDCGTEYGIGFVDVTTGQFQVSSVPTESDVITDCYRFGPVELLLGPTIRENEDFVTKLQAEFEAELTEPDENAFAPGAAKHTIRSHFGRQTIESLDIDDAAVRAGGAIISYIDDTGVNILQSLTRLQTFHSTDHVELDATTQRNLELTETMTRGRHGSLLGTIDHTASSAGTRLLREWLTRPTRDLDCLDRRHECVDALMKSALPRAAIRETLGTASDLERLATRASNGSIDPRGLLNIRNTLELLPDLSSQITGTDRLAQSPLRTIIDSIDQDDVSTLHQTLTNALVEDPPRTITEGGIFKKGYTKDLDGVIERYEKAQEWIEALPTSEKRRLNITHLLVDRNRTDGYYIQVGKSEVEKVPPEYKEIKTLKNSKRFTTDELQEREREVFRFEEERADLEYDLFIELRDEVADLVALLQDVGRMFAEIDVLASLAEHAASNGWTRPAFGDDGITITSGRHPVVEQTTEFVPNDIQVSENRRFLVVTGPNMSGKSTYLRQTALIVLLAQIGSYVPAERAKIDIVDGIFTRVGALDELAQGRSTFMVEMQELSNILHSATDESLVILDEVGRGTSTYDGISIAWATTEYLHNNVRSFTLFATHYHELTKVAEYLPDVENVHVAAEEQDGNVTFLRNVREGATDRSYGIHVADLAGVPGPVVDRARDVLDKLRREKAIEAKGGSISGGPQQVVFDIGSGKLRTGNGDAPEPDTTRNRDSGEEVVLMELQRMDITELTPSQLYEAIERWQTTLE